MAVSALRQLNGVVQGVSDMRVTVGEFRRGVGSPTTPRAANPLPPRVTRAATRGKGPSVSA